MNLSRLTILLAISVALAGVSFAGDAASAFQSRVLPLLKANCSHCHGTEKQKAKITLVNPRSLEQLASERDLWFRVLDQVEYGLMPPEDEAQPTPQERQQIAAWIRGEFTDHLAAQQRKDGRSKLRRYSRAEYANTFEDLFGMRPDVDNLPEDGRVDGYNKVSAALPLSADGALGYLTISEDLVKKWVLRPAPKETEAARTVHAIARESEQSKGHILELPDGTMVSFNTDTTSGPVKYPGSKVPGIHHLRVSVYGYQTDKPLPFGIYVGNTWGYPQQLELAKMLEAPPGKAAVVETDLYLKAGVGIRLIPFGLGVPVPKNSLASKCTAPGLAVQWLEDVQPEQPLLADRFFTADFPKPLADEIRAQYGNVVLKHAKSTNRVEFLTVMQATFKRIGARLYRRDLTGPELSQILDDIAKQIDSGVPLGTAFFDKINDLMTSPDFFCVVEPPGQLSDFALASRLSYFLWNSTPDETLLDLARHGKLHDPKVLKEQTDRLLNDPKSERFVADFSSQWLGLYAIDDTSPDANLYPGYSDLLKRSSALETQNSFRRILAENLSVRDFVDPRWALVNEPLAQHYGLPEIKGMALQKVDLPANTPYGGLWTQSAVLKVTANGTNTSPVKRGVWVAKRLLGIPIPPPPPNIKPVEPDVRGAKTLREQLALHSSSGSCVGCHAKFDPYGFALESFDVTGNFRKNYREVDPETMKLPPNQRKGRQTWRDGLPVDCSGKTPDGKTFTGIVELRQMLSKEPEALARGVTRHLLTYATGAPTSALDQQAIESIVKSAAPDDYGLRSLIHGLVQSELFRWK